MGRADRIRVLKVTPLALTVVAIVTSPVACALVIGDLPDPVETKGGAGSGGALGSSQTGGAGAGAGAGGGTGAAGAGGGSGAAGGTSGQAGSGAGGSAGQLGSAGQGGSGQGGGGQGGSGQGGSGQGGSGQGGSGQGGGQAGSAGKGGTGGQGGSSGCDPCDCDADGVRAERCGGTDCADDDANVKPGQTSFFPSMSPSATGIGFDYNCNRQIEHEYRQINCGLLSSCSPSDIGFIENVPCGQSGTLTTCVKTAGLVCSNGPTSQAVMRCH